LQSKCIKLHIFFVIYIYLYGFSVFDAIVIICPIALMPYKYLELQVIVAISECDYKPNCKTPNFFHIVSKAPRRWVLVVILWLHPLYFSSIQIKFDIVQFSFILLILLYYAKWFPIPTTSKEYQLQVHIILLL